MAETSRDQKTEAPTPRRLEKALEDGQVAFSSELISGVVVLAGVMFFMLFGKWFFDQILLALRERLTWFAPMVDNEITIFLAIKRSVMQSATVVGSLMGFVVLVSVLTSALQTNVNISFKALAVKWNRLNPQSGIQRIFSSRSVTRGLVAIAKSTAIIVAAWFLTGMKLGEIHRSGSLTLEAAIGLGAKLSLSIGVVTAVQMVFIGAIDFIYQRWKHHQDLMMSQQEIRDENKEIEGDPMIKARIRRLQNERSKRKTLEQVPKATVVITNPTHYAVALRYDTSENDAPIVIAKGTDHLALKIREVAEAHGIAIVERKPLARFLYANVSIGNPIPFEIYHAVAEILNFIRQSKSYV